MASAIPIAPGLARSWCSSSGTAIRSRPVARVATNSAAMSAPLRLRIRNVAMVAYLKAQATQWWLRLERSRIAGSMKDAPCGAGNAQAPRLGMVTEAMADRSLVEVMDWIVREAPGITDLEIGTGAYAPTAHCDLPLLLRDAGARRRWTGEIAARGLRLGAFNAWGNPLHPDAAIAAKHDADLRDTIRLAAALGVERVVALAGCPEGEPGDRTPHFAAGGWLPYLEGISERQWQRRVLPYWTAIAELARSENPELLVCIELHPGSVVFNCETFDQLTAAGPSIAANVDPSHFFWMGMDPLAVVDHLGAHAGHCHGKDVVFSADSLALNGLLDRRWPRPAEAMPWNFAVVGRGREEDWWRRFVAELCAKGRVHTIAIEHEDPFVPAASGVKEAAAVLSRAIAAACSPAPNA
jgi:sugar phosphate isomerase/epimerase